MQRSSVDSSLRFYNKNLSVIVENFEEEIHVIEISKTKKSNDVKKWCIELLKEYCTPETAKFGGIDLKYFEREQIHKAEFIFYRDSEEKPGFLTAKELTLFRDGRTSRHVQKMEIDNSKKILYIDAICVKPGKKTTEALMKKVEEWALIKKYNLIALRAAWRELVPYYEKFKFVLGAGGEISDDNPSGKTSENKQRYNACNDFPISADVDKDAYDVKTFYQENEYDGTGNGWWMSKCIMPEKGPDPPLSSISTKDKQGAWEAKRRSEMLIKKSKTYVRGGNRRRS